MANCFGEVVDDYALEAMSRYLGKPKTQEDRAREASSLDNLDDKSEKAHSYVHGLKSWYGNGVSTLCLVYNQTGDTLHYVADHDYQGFLGRTPYPTEIGNGQWAAFHHVHMTAREMTHSAGAVVYRGKDKNGQERDFLLGWRSPYDPIRKNKAYCEVGGGIDYFQSRWDAVLDNMEDSGYSKTHTTDEAEIVAHVAQGYSPVYVARIKIPFRI